MRRAKREKRRATSSKIFFNFAEEAGTFQVFLQAAVGNIFRGIIPGIAMGHKEELGAFNGAEIDTFRGLRKQPVFISLFAVCRFGDNSFQVLVLSCEGAAREIRGGCSFYGRQRFGRRAGAGVIFRILRKIFFAWAICLILHDIVSKKGFIFR